MAGFDDLSVDYVAIQNAIRTKTRKRSCPACEFSGGWDGADEIVLLDVAHRQGPGNGAPPDPQADMKSLAVVINCPECGYTETYNLLVLLGDSHTPD